LKDASFGVSPDPIEHGKPFTFELTGNLDEDLTEILADVDLDIKFLGVFHKQIKRTIRFSGKPKISKGNTKVVVGPFVLDDGWAPASIYASGTVHLRDSKGEAVACGLLQDVNFGSERAGGSASEVEIVGESQPEHMGLQAIQNCGMPSDHIQNLVVTQNQTSVRITGSVDEPLNDVKLYSTNTVSKFFFSKTISVTTPITYSPGLPAGDFELNIEVLGEPLPAAGLSLEGKLQLKDRNDEQMVCVKYQQQVMDTVTV
jgi:hypothetical protein